MANPLTLLSLILSFNLLSASCLAQGGEGFIPAPSYPPRGLSFGAAGAANVNFSVQRTESSASARVKNTTTFATGELLVAYTWPQGWRLESGLGVGSVVAVTLDAIREFGRGSAVSFGTMQIPLRLHKHIPLGNSRFTVSPHVGLQNVTISIGEISTARQVIFPGKPGFGTSCTYFASLRQNTLTYQAGLGLNYLARKFEIGLFGRYTNSFGSPVVASGRWEYDREGVEQPALISESRLESIAVGLSIRRTFYAR